MSQIDCYQHELVGLIAGLQLYHPLEPIADFGVDQFSLMLGGGSGEHPEAVFDPGRAVCSFLLQLSDELFRDDVDMPAWRQLEYVQQLGAADANAAEEVLCGDILDALAGDVDHYQGHFTWNGDTWAHFIEQARNPGCWTTPYDRAKHGTIEHWINYCIGEFVLISMPELIAHRVPDELTELFDTIRDLTARTKIMMGVMTFPTGYENLGGRRLQLGDGNVRH